MLRQLGARFDQTRVRRLISPRPNPESSLAFFLGPDYMANFSPGRNFSPVNRAEILLRLHDELQPGLKY